MSFETSDELLDKLSQTYGELVKQAAIGNTTVIKRQNANVEGSTVDVHVTSVDRTSGQTLIEDTTAQNLQTSVYQESFTLAADKLLNRITVLKLISAAGDDYRTAQNVTRLRDAFRVRAEITEKALTEVVLTLSESLEELDQQLTNSRAQLN